MQFADKMQLVALCVAMLACAVSAQWKPLTTDLETFDTGVDFSSDLVGYTAGDAGSGPEVYQTTDGLLGATECEGCSIIIASTHSCCKKHS